MFTGIGTVANAAAIVAGTVAGLVLRRGLPDKVEKTLKDAVSLAVVVIGVQMALKTTNALICVISLALGAIIGEFADLDKGFNYLGSQAGNFLAHGDASAGSRIAAGFVSASLLFCPGAMAVIGSIQDGLVGDPSTLFVKSLLDGIFSVVMAANLGVGVALSALSVGLYQGSITLLAGVLETVATPVVLAEITSVGGVMILGIGLNLLGLTKIKIANLVPGLIPAIVLAYYFG